MENAQQQQQQRDFDTVHASINADDGKDVGAPEVPAALAPDSSKEGKISSDDIGASVLSPTETSSRSIILSSSPFSSPEALTSTVDDGQKTELSDEEGAVVEFKREEEEAMVEDGDDARVFGHFKDVVDVTLGDR